MAISNFIKIKAFNNTKEMMLWHYIKYLETNDDKYFSSYYDVLIPYPISKKKLSNAKDTIYNELTKDSFKIKERIGTIHKIEKLKVKYKDVNRLVDAMLMQGTSKEMFILFVAQLKKWGHKIKENYNVLDQLYRIKEINQSLISEIESLNIELSKEQNQEKIEIEEVIFNIEQGLEMNFKVDTKKTSLFEWELMQKRMSKKIEMINKKNEKR